MSASPLQVRQWSDELAADPASLAFLPLARAYRDSGKRDAALRLCIRGLERHPNHVDAHHLLGLLYRDAGERVKAEDEWGIALALSPEHAGARREMGLSAFARGDWAAAVRHLEQARAGDVTDQEVRSALEEAWRHSRGSAPAPAPAAPPSAPAAPAEAWDGGRVFDALASEIGALAHERGIVGAVVLDAQGFVVAGEMQVEGRDRSAEVAAVLSGASSEAERAVKHLKMGAWKGILVETPQAVVRLAPTGDGGMVAVAGRRDVPMGWVLRVAGRARESAERFIAAMGGR
jgi:predicted regulator of Ras-like GTPase activity (Roadblock/LC7/MglB family)